MNLKIGSLKSKQSSTLDLLSELNVSKTNLCIFLNKLDRSSSNCPSSSQILNAIEHVTLVLDNINCVLNTLIYTCEMDYFRHFEFLIEHLNSDNSPSESINEHSNRKVLFDKVKLISIRSFQSKFMVDLFKTKYERIMWDELTFSQKTNHSHFVLKNVDYAGETRQTYSLLKRFSLSLNRHERFDFVVNCEHANVYLRLSFINNFLYSRFFALCIDRLVNLKREQQDSYSKHVVLKFRLLHSYIHFIHLSSGNDVSETLWVRRNPKMKCFKAKPPATKTVYSLGANELYLNLESARSSQIVFLEILHPILFKSAVNCEHKKFSNNLFANQMSHSNFNYLFEFIKSGGRHRQRHYWGSLLGVNNLTFKLKNCDVKKSVSLLIDSFNFEYSIDVLNLINYLVDLHNQKFASLKIESNNLMDNDRLAQFMANSQKKLNVKAFNFYILFRRHYLLVFQLENFNITKTIQVIIVLKILYV